MGSVEYDQLFRLDYYSGANQITRVFDDQEKYEAFKSVAGDVGIITLGERIVFLEGKEQADKFILDIWFVGHKGKVTFVSCGPLINVMAISEKILDLLTISSRFKFFYSIRDRDFLSEEKREELIKHGDNRLFVWSKYHIENYLLDFDVIYSVLAKVMGPRNPFHSPNDVLEKMENVVRKNSERFISKMVNFRLNSIIRSISVNVGFPDVRTQAFAKSKKTLEYFVENLTEKKVDDIIAISTKEFEESITKHTWANSLPGRDVLKLFLGKYGHGLTYEQFKNLLVSEIASQGKIPQEVTDTINHVISVR